MLQQHCCTPATTISQYQWLQAHLGIPLDARYLAEGKACFSQSLVVSRRNSDDANVVGWLTISARHQTSEASLLLGTADSHPGYQPTAVSTITVVSSSSFVPLLPRASESHFRFLVVEGVPVNSKAYMYECNRHLLASPRRCRPPAAGRRMAEEYPRSYYLRIAQQKK